MPSVVIPPEVWARIFFFVAPPLPHLGIERQSFAEDAKASRDRSEPGRWADINTLMLVSKRVNELACPFFWSYLVLTSYAKAMAVAKLLSTLPDRDTIHAMVRVIQLPGDLEPERAYEHASLVLARRFPKLAHIHLSATRPLVTSVHLLASLAMRSEPYHVPLRGLSGVIVGDANWEAALLALRTLAPSLRRLSIATLNNRLPLSARSAYAATQNLHFPSLVAISIDGLEDTTWLEGVAKPRWTLPCLVKCSMSMFSTTNEPRVFAKHTLLDSARKPNSLMLPLARVGANFPVLAALNLQELAVSIEARVGVNAAGWKACLDRVPTKSTATIKVVVVVESLHKGPTLHSADNQCRIELVNRTRLPSLEKVIWVTKSRDEDSTNWPGPLMR